MESKRIERAMVSNSWCSASVWFLYPFSSLVVEDKVVLSEACLLVLVVSVVVVMLVVEGGGRM